MKLENKYLEYLVLKFLLNPRLVVFILLTTFLMGMYLIFGMNHVIFTAAGEGTSPPVYPENGTGGGSG